LPPIAGALAAEAVAARTALSPAAAARVGGAVLVVAGLYQLMPLKDVCLSKCRTPLGFIMTSWRDGAAGALRMGLLHGAYCLGCCWLLFVILFPLGIMNVAAMAVITLVIFAEKTLPWGRVVARAVAVVLIAYGAAVVAVPQLLPPFPAGHDMQMPKPG
jgi:predicted metal-binding membrane protein